MWPFKPSTASHERTFYAAIDTLKTLTESIESSKDGVRTQLETLGSELSRLEHLRQQVKSTLAN